LRDGEELAHGYDEGFHRCLLTGVALITISARAPAPTKSSLVSADRQVWGADMNQIPESEKIRLVEELLRNPRSPIRPEAVRSLTNEQKLALFDKLVSDGAILATWLPKNDARKKAEEERNAQIKREQDAQRRAAEAAAKAKKDQEAREAAERAWRDRERQEEERRKAQAAEQLRKEQEARERKEALWKKRAYFTTAAIVIVGALGWYGKNSLQKQEAQEAFGEFVTSHKPQICEYTSKEGNTKTEGTVYAISAGYNAQVRINALSKLENKTIETHSIAKLKNVYFWISNMNQGIKYSSGDRQTREILTSKWLTGFECKDWRESDYSLFELPPNIEFTELSEKQKRKLFE
jgi:hypothetical protein